MTWRHFFEVLGWLALFVASCLFADCVWLVLKDIFGHRVEQWRRDRRDFRNVTRANRRPPARPTNRWWGDE